jgi:hypothetical protein
MAENTHLQRTCRHPNALSQTKKIKGINHKAANSHHQKHQHITHNPQRMHESILQHRQSWQLFVQGNTNTAKRIK